MKIGSSADWHIGANMDEDIKSSVLQMKKIFSDQKVDLIVLPGDFFDEKSTADGRNLLRHLIQELTEVSMVIGCYGNHDRPGDLDIFGHLEVNNPIIICNHPVTFPLPLKPEVSSIVHVFPWFTKATWQADHIGASKEEGDKTVSQMALQYLKNAVMIQKEKHPGAKHILVSHLMINGCLAENHQPMIGEGVTFGRHDLFEAGFDAGIFGHIHLKQVFDDVGPYFYNGSPAPMDYGESPDKYCSVLDTDSLEIEWFKLNTIDRFSIELSYDEPGFHNKLHEAAVRIKDARVRVTIKIPEGEDISHIKSGIEKFLQESGALESKVEHQTQPKDIVRAVEITAAETMEEKLEASWKAFDNRPDDKTAAGMKAKLAEVEMKIR